MTDPFARKNNAKAMDLELTPRQMIRFTNKIALGSKDEYCWPWVGGCDGKGYGKVTINGRKYMAHRVAYAIWIGRIEAKMEIDHLCCNRCCVNPEHLEMVIKAENLKRHMQRAGKAPF